MSAASSAISRDLKADLAISHEMTSLREASEINSLAHLAHFTHGHAKSIR